MQEVKGAVKWIYGGPSSNHTVWEVPCNSKNKVVLKLGLRDYELRPDDWTFATRSRCFSEFAYLSESGREAQLGTRFLEAFYTLWNLNPPEIGLMHLRPELPHPSQAPIEASGPGHDAAASIDELRLHGPVPPLRDAAAYRPSNTRYTAPSYALVVLGFCLSAYCLFRLWRRVGGSLSLRAPMSAEASKYRLISRRTMV